jgi:hypothetical protein
LIHPQIHDMTLAFGADPLPGQESASGGDPLRSRQASGCDHRRQVDPIQPGHKQPPSSPGCAEGTRRQIQATHLGDLGDLGLDGGRALVVGAASNAGEALFAAARRGY